MSGLMVFISITEGDQYRVGNIDFQGELEVEKEELFKKIKLKSGDIFNRSVFRNDIFTLTDFYGDKGYAFANISPMTRINQANKTVDVTYNVEKGQKVYIDRITIAGNNTTRDKVARRELRLVEGDLYSGTGLKVSKQRLNNLGFFEEVNIATAKGTADNKLNVNVDVKEKATGTFTIGAGYSSMDGVIGQGSVQESNFLGLGLKANASAAVGGKSQTYNFGLTDPYFLDSKWTVGGDVYRAERDYIDFTRRVTGGDVKAGYPLSDVLSTFWIYRYEQKEIFDESSAYLTLKNQGLTTDQSGITSAITASLSRNTTDYRLDPSSGTVSSLSVEFAGLGGDTRFVRYQGETAVFYPVKWGSVFSLHGEMGYLQRIGQDISIDEKYYLGGINTLRGYDARSVCPTKTVLTPIGTVFDESTGQAVQGYSDTRVYLGGNKEVVFNAELTVPLLKDVGLKGVGFFDAGNAYGEGEHLFTRFLTSYGGGIRWLSPIGPLRLEYGIPLNPREGIDNSGGKLEFSIGGFF
jgi:outer membrane protein insertion porin family